MGSGPAAAGSSAAAPGRRYIAPTLRRACVVQAGAQPSGGSKVQLGFLDQPGRRIVRPPRPRLCANLKNAKQCEKHTVRRRARFCRRFKTETLGAHYVHRLSSVKCGGVPSQEKGES